MQFFSKTSLTAAILLSMQSFNAYSLVVQLDITTTSSATTDGIAINSADTISTVGIAESEAEAWNDPSNNYGYAHSIGRSNGSFYNKATGDATFSAAGHVAQLYTVTNDQSIDQDINFDFQVLWGGIGANCGGAYGEDNFFEGEIDGAAGTPCTGNDFALANYSAQIFVDGTSIWDSAAQIKTDASGTTGSSSGVDLNIGGYTGGTSYNWGPQDFTLDLGSLASGESFTLEYTIDVFTEGFLANGDYNYASANFGDPNGFGATGNSFTSSTASVPEPMTLGLLLSGLFSLGFMNRKRNKR